MIFGVARIINLSHGALIMWGAYTALIFFLLGVIPLETALIALVIGLAAGSAVFYVILRRLIGSHELTTLLATFALSIFLEELSRAIFGLDYRGYSYYIGSLTISYYKIPLTTVLGSVISVAAVVLLNIFLYKTRVGRSVRAVAQDSVGAYICGVDVDKIYSFSIGLGFGLAMFGGVVLTLYNPTGINPYMGGPYLLKSFVIVVLGGLGSIVGAFIGGVIFGIIETSLFPIYSALNFHSPLSMTIFSEFLLLLLLLLLRPQGIFSK